MKFHLAVLCWTLGLLHAVPLKPGEPGGPWTDEEVRIVKERIRVMLVPESKIGMDGRGDYFKGMWLEHPVAKSIDRPLDEYSLPHEGDSLGPRRTEGPDWKISKWTCRTMPSPGKLVQLGFHDCMKYKNGKGGCDGCINWHGVGFKPENFIRYHEETYKKFPITRHTNNNKLQMTVKSLEFIYNTTDWPLSAPALKKTLWETGKSRADLWQLAANVGLEVAVNKTNRDCRVKRWQKELHVTATEGWDKCEIKSHKEIPFQYGRRDCVPDPEKKWTPYPFEATDEENHSNPFGTGEAVLKDLKRDFGLTARESISLMASHGLQCKTHNFELGAKYIWFGAWTFSNIYFKYLNGKTYFRGNPLGPEFFSIRGSSREISRPGGLDNDYFIGDKFGNPVDGTAWMLQCKFAWNNTGPDNGPCFFRPSQAGCRKHQDPDLDMRKECFETLIEGGARKRIPGCEDAKIDPVTFVQTGGPREDKDLCRAEGRSFGLPYEVSLVLNFTVDHDNHPRGCGPLDEDIMKGKKVEQLGGGRAPLGPPIYDGSPGYHGSPPCGPNKYAPEGETTTDIVASFADDHDLWAKTFLEAWEKMQKNGYLKEELKNGPDSAGLLKNVKSVAERGPMKPFQQPIVHVDLQPIEDSLCIPEDAPGCSDVSSVDPIPVILENMDGDQVLTMEKGKWEKIQLRPFTDLDTQKWKIQVLCSGEINLFNVGIRPNVPLRNGPWKYDCRSGLLRGKNGAWALNAGFWQTLDIKYKRIRGQSTNVPGDRYRWRMIPDKKVHH